MGSSDGVADWECCVTHNRLAYPVHQNPTDIRNPDTPVPGTRVLGRHGFPPGYPFAVARTARARYEAPAHFVVPGPRRRGYDGPLPLGFQSACTYTPRSLNTSFYASASARARQLQLWLSRAARRARERPSPVPLVRVDEDTVRSQAVLEGGRQRRQVGQGEDSAPSAAGLRSALL